MHALNAMRRFLDPQDPTGKCSMCSSLEHQPATCPQNPERMAPELCELCELGHSTSNCPLMHQACGNCGQHGHKPADCSEPKTERASDWTACRLCGQRGHKASVCPEPDRLRKCFHCEQPGHLSAVCPYKSLSKVDAVAAAHPTAAANGMPSAGRAALAAPSVNHQLRELYKVRFLP